MHILPDSFDQFMFSNQLINSFVQVGLSYCSGISMPWYNNNALILVFDDRN